MKLKKLILTTVTSGLICISGIAQDGGITSRGALDMILQRFGPESVRYIVELRGENGVPQPEEWEMLSYSENAPRLLHWFKTDARRASDEGEDDEFYPKTPPLGYFTLDKVMVDSKAAFTIAEAEASKARMGFDELKYVLRVREFSKEPIWTVELVDSERMMVGKVYLSAENGEVLRTIWVYRDERSRSDGRPLIIDSAVPRDNGSEMQISSNREMPGGQPQFQPQAPLSQPQLDQIPIPNEPPAAQRRMVEPIPQEIAPPVTQNPTPPNDPLSDMRKVPATRPPAEVPIFQKPSSNGGTDTRIPPPPIPPSSSGN